MALLLGTAVLATLAASLAVTWALFMAGEHVERLASTQRRLEALSAISGRVGDYAIVALQASAMTVGGPGNLNIAAGRVQEAFRRFDDEIAAEVNRMGDEARATLMAARSRSAAHMRARFDLLNRQAATLLSGPAAGGPAAEDRLKVSLDLFATGFGPALSQAIETERSAAQAEQVAMRAFRARLMRGTAAALIVALLLAIFVYRALARPLLRRVSDMAAGARDIGRGRLDTRLEVSGRDELSLAMARFNRMAAHLARREARLVADQRHLQQTVEARTAELRAANLRLADIDQARRRFFTDVSHELRTPLTVILGEAEVSLRGKGADADGLRAALGVIRSRARRLHRRVEDLLRIARSETGQIELDIATIDVAGLLAEAREGVDGLARMAGMTIDVAPGGQGLNVRADREWMRQVIEGLMVNALRHSPPGGTIRLAAAAAGHGVEIRVEDDGAGIPPADLPHVFERFYRGVDHPREGAGFGIGLALAKWIVEQHSGTIAIRSRTASAGQGESGTVVTLHLPDIVPLYVAGAAQ